MKEFVDKLIDRLKEESKKWFDIWVDTIKEGDYDNYADGMNDAFEEAIKIVNQLAKEFGKDTNVHTNGGWIPCSERLPQMGDYVLCSVNEKYGEHSIIISKFADESYWHDGRITAWQPLPAPYQSEGE